MQHQFLQLFAIILSVLSQPLNRKEITKMVLQVNLNLMSYIEDYSMKIISGFC